MIKPGITTTVLGLAIAFQAHAVETLGEKDMGAIHMASGQILNVFGAPAAGEVSRVADENDTPPPIEQTASTVSAIAMALEAPDILRNPPERDFTRNQDPFELIFPEIALNVPTVRNVPSPVPTGGGTSFRILSGEQVITSSLERRPGEATDALRINNSTRVDEIRISDVRFPNGNGLLDNGSIVISGLVVEADVLIYERP